MSMQYWLFVILTLAFTAFLGYNTYRTALILRVKPPDENLLLMSTETIARLGMIAACVGLGMLSGLEPEQLGWTLEDWQSNLFWGVLWGSVLAVVFYFSTRWIISRSGNRYYSPTMLEALIPQDRREFLLIMLAMISVVILEELLFRSLLLGGFLPILPAALLVVVIGAAFGLMHAPQGSWGMVGAGLAGILMGGMFLWSGSIVMPLAAHYITNMAQILLVMRLHRSRDYPMQQTKYQ